MHETAAAYEGCGSTSLERLSSSPYISLERNVVAALDLRRIQALAAPLFAPALVSSTGAGVASAGRLADVAWLPHGCDPTVSRVVELMSRHVGLERASAEQLQVARYPTGGEYKPHFDAYHLATERGRRCTAVRGQRLFTAILYLNDDFEGGCTVFPKLGISVQPAAGALLAFENVTEDRSAPDPRTLHAGASVLRGEKWIATLWFRER